MKKYNIFAGNYGSGKTEISLNLAKELAMQKKRVMLLDMDIVNPYFRSSEHEEMLKALGIRVVKPCFANTNVDVPSLPAEIYSAFTLPLDAAIFDAGGDPVGAAALGQLADRFDRTDLEFYYVINALRPLQENAGEIIQMMRQIEARSQLQVTSLINNTNLAGDTTAEHVKQGYLIVQEVAKETGLPIAFSSIREGISAQDVGAIKSIHIFTRPDWLDMK